MQDGGITIQIGGGGGGRGNTSSSQSDGQRQQDQLQNQQRQQRQQQQRQEVRIAQQRAAMMRAVTQTAAQRESRLPATIQSIPVTNRPQFEEFLKTASPFEVDWFEENPKSFALIVVNREIRLNTANFFRSTIPNIYIKEEKLRSISQERIRELEAAKAAILNDVGWKTASLGALANILGGTINAFCNLLLDIIPAGISYTPTKEFYAAVTDVLTKGDLINFDSWRAAINDAMVNARIEDMLTKTSTLAKLTAAFIAFAGKLSDIVNREDDRDALKNEVKSQIDAINREIDKINQSTRMQGRMEQLYLEVLSLSAELIDLNFQYIGYVQMRHSLSFRMPSVSRSRNTGLNLIVAGWPLYLLLAIRSRVIIED